MLGVCEPADSPSSYKVRFTPLSERFRKRCKASDGTHISSALLADLIDAVPAVSAIRMTPSPSTVTALAPA
jgi:hypothetical protein